MKSSHSAIRLKPGAQIAPGATVYCTEYRDVLVHNRLPPISRTGPALEGFTQGIILMRGGSKPAACLLSRIFDRSSRGSPVPFPARHPDHFFRWPAARRTPHGPVIPHPLGRDGEAFLVRILLWLKAQMLGRGGSDPEQEVQSATAAQRHHHARHRQVGTAWSAAEKCCSPSQCSPALASNTF